MATTSIFPGRRGSAPSAAEMQHVVALFARRDYDEAARAARALRRRFPRDGFALKALAAVLCEQGQWAEAVKVCDGAAGGLRQDAEFANNFGTALKNVGRVAEAETEYRRAIALRAGYAAAWDNLGVLLQQSARMDEAETCLLRAIACDARYAPAQEHLGNLLLLQCRIPEAEAAYRRALALARTARVWNNLGSLLQGAGRNAEAEACFRAALEMDAAYAPGWNSLGHLLASHGMHAEAELCFRRTLELDAQHAVAHSNLLFSMAHCEATTPETLLAEHLAFRERFETPLRREWREPVNTREPERVLRVGFVSGDLHDHALVRYLKPMLDELKLYPELELVAYANDRIEDHVTAELKQVFALWRPVSLLTDAELAEQVREDAVDVLIDLSGHTGYNRLLAFARKPAPVQVSWMGYVGTSGLEAMDYFVADEHFVPRVMEAQFTEKLLHLPACTPFRPHARAPEVNALPALQAGQFTFGSFNRVSKLSREVIAAWGKILRGAPGSRMLLAAMPDAMPPARLVRWFAEEGIAPERLTFLGGRGVEATLRLHHMVDLCLDPFPYAGSTVNNHALWMGVPTLTWPREIVASRMGAALALHVGIAEFVAGSREEYVAKAVALAQDPSALVELRPKLRGMFAESIFLQPAVIAESLVLALRVAWRRWCAGLEPDTFRA